MAELADQSDDLLAGAAMDDARRLHEVVCALSPIPAEVSAAGHSLVSDLGLVIRQDRRAA
jgi:hypothetical protein